MYHANGHTVNRNHHNEKRTTMQERIRKVRQVTRYGQGFTPDTNPNHIIADRSQELTRDDDSDMLFWG